jgi:hypothetical protein
MLQSLSLYGNENFSLINESSSSVRFEHEERFNQIKDYQAYKKGLKRDISNNDVEYECKRFKDSNTFFNFEDLSKELDEIEFGASDYMDSQSCQDMNVATLSQMSVMNNCLNDKNIGFVSKADKAPNACSTKLDMNGTDLDILNISSCSVSVQRHRRNTL